MKVYITYSHLMEIMHNKAECVTGILFFFEGLVNIISPSVLLAFSKNTDILIYIALALNLFSILLFFKLYIPESIKYSLANNKYDQA